MKRFLTIVIIIGVVAFSFSVVKTFINDIKDKKINEENDNKKNDEELHNRANEIMDSMTIDEKIGQMIFVRPEGLNGFDCDKSSPTINISDNSINNLKKYNIGGIVFFSDNIKDKETLVKYINDLQKNSKYSLFIGVDEEGGRVSRLGNKDNLDVTHFPSMKTIGDSNDFSKAFNVGDTLGKELKKLGFNLNFAPVADINTNPNNPVIGNRSFGDNKEIVSSMVVEVVKGLQGRNVSATLKHFPGHGDTSTDSHKDMATVSFDKDRLEKTELIPFKKGIKQGADFVLTAHISLPNVVGDNTPATMSKMILTDILRNELGFDKIIITDSLEMKSLTDYYDTKDIVINSVNAGADVLLLPTNMINTFNIIKNAVENGNISKDRIDESVRRILKVKLERNIIK